MGNGNQSNKNTKVEPAKLEHDIERFPGRQLLSEDEGHQLLRELSKEEMTLKQLIYEFTQELEKTKMEESMLRNLIEQHGKPFVIQNGHSKSNNHNTHSIDDDAIQQQEEDEDIDMREAAEPIDGDMQLMDLFKDILN